MWLCQYCGHEWPKAPNSRRSSKCPECKEKATIESSSN
ncbi:zinc-ribbon domain-containing protein [Virgibacillus sp. SK37]